VRRSPLSWWVIADRAYDYDTKSVVEAGIRPVLTSPKEPAARHGLEIPGLWSTGQPLISKWKAALSRFTDVISNSSL